MFARYQSPHLHFAMGNLLTSARSLTRMASSFNLPDWETPVPIHLTSNLSQEQLLSFPAFSTWTSTLRHSLTLQQNMSHPFHSSPYKLRRIDIQCADFFGGQRLGFIKLTATITNDKDEKLPGSVFLRGGSVAILVCSQRWRVQVFRRLTNTACSSSFILLTPAIPMMRNM
jgi:hypothetical protein